MFKSLKVKRWKRKLSKKLRREKVIGCGHFDYQKEWFWCQ
jgi:hypothetical protein